MLKKMEIISQDCRCAFIRYSLYLLLTFALLESPLPSIGQTATSDIKVLIHIVRGQHASRSYDTLNVLLMPSLTPIANSAVLVNKNSTPNNSVEGRNRRHAGLFPTAVQNLKIYIQKMGEPSLPVPFSPRMDIKPSMSAVIDVPDGLILTAPASDSSTTRPLGDVELRWKSRGPDTTYEVRVFETATIPGTEVFNRSRITGYRMLIPASTFAAGKTYRFQVAGWPRNIGTLSGSYAAGSKISINTYVQCFITFTAK